jgi:chaperone required for assembly of F1-ATPase
MKTRGRKSAASQEIAAPGTTELIARPDAPYDLTDEQSAEWWAVVNRMPADWFPRETHGMLTQYCRHVVAARRVAQLVAKAEKNKTFDLEEYDRLLKMQEREGRAISSLATRMRISQQATVRADAARKPDMVDDPWEFQG